MQEELLPKQWGRFRGEFYYLKTKFRHWFQQLKCFQFQGKVPLVDMQLQANGKLNCELEFYIFVQRKLLFNSNQFVLLQ